MTDSSSATDSTAAGIDKSEPAVESQIAQGAQADSPPATETQTDTSAASSPAKAEKPKDYLEAVKTALDKPKADASPAAKTDGSDPAQEQAETQEGDDLGEEPPDFTKEERAQLSVKTERRLRYLSGQAKRFQQELEQVKPQAEQMGRINQFVTQANLSQQDVTAGFEMMRLMKNDPEQAYEKLVPIFIALRKMVGEVLPDDLKQKVDTGVMPLEEARRLSRTTASLELRKQREATTTEEATRKAAAQATENQWRAGADTLNAWEASWAKTDLDYQRKLPDVQEKIELELLRWRTKGQIPTPVQAREIADRALAEVNKRSKKSVRPIDPGPTGAPSNPAALPKPKTYHEAVLQGLNAARR